MVVTAPATPLAQVDVQAIAERIGRHVAADVLDPLLRPIVKERAAAEAAPFAPALTAAVVVPVLLTLGLIAALAVRARGGDGLGISMHGAVESEKWLIIKGNKFTAARAAANHGIPFAFDRETHRGQETVGFTTAGAIALNEWFVETREAPFPPGALLFWGDRKPRTPA